MAHMAPFWGPFGREDFFTSPLQDKLAAGKTRLVAGAPEGIGAEDGEDLRQGRANGK